MDRHELQGIPAQVIQPPLRAVGQDADVAAQHLGALLDIAGELFFGFLENSAGQVLLDLDHALTDFDIDPPAAFDRGFRFHRFVVEPNVGGDQQRVDVGLDRGFRPRRLAGQPGNNAVQIYGRHAPKRIGGRLPAPVSNVRVC